MQLLRQSPFPNPWTESRFGELDAETLTQNVTIFNQNMDLISEALSGINNSPLSVVLPTGDYNVGFKDYFIGSVALTSPAIIKLPSAILIGFTCNIKMLGPQKVTIVPSGFDTIDGFNYPISLNRRFTSLSFITYSIGEWGII